MAVAHYAGLLLVFSAITVNCERNSQCTTPNGETATCKPVRACQVILEAVQSHSPAAIEFAKQSQCGYDTEPLVCCGSLTYLDLSITLTTPKTSNFNTTLLPNETVCGSIPQYGSIVAEITEIDEFIWVVALEYKSKVTGESVGIRCDGSLINSKYILTAGHCISHEKFELISVWLGDWQLSTDPDCVDEVGSKYCADPIQKLKIKEQILHPLYDGRYGHDIGLIKLENDITYTEFIQPICLPSTNNSPSPTSGTLMTVAGWGVTTNGTLGDFKTNAGLSLLSNNDCKQKFKNLPLGDNQLCAANRERKYCKGHLGQPVMQIEQHESSRSPKWYLEGVISYGDGCNSEAVPLVYTRVVNYMDWIINNISQD